MPQNSWKIAVIPGDGIGKETTPEGIRVLEAAAKRFDLGFDFTDHDFASADYYEKHGQMLPDDWKDQLGGSDALFFGAVFRHCARSGSRCWSHIPLWRRSAIFF